MKAAIRKDINTPLHPKDNPNFTGHHKNVDILENIIDSGKIPQSWIFSGPKGIGKATLAYRFARFLLAAPEEIYSLIPNNEKLHISATNPTFTRIQAGSHSDLLVLEPDGETASNNIKVDDVRKINDFLRLTASETKYRIVIIDSADDMNTNAANAVLKLLEEPPKRAILILISHSPGKLLPTIKSRCRNLRMSTLNEKESLNILENIIPKIDSIDAKRLIQLSEGSPGIAVELYQNKGIQIYEAIIDILITTPRIDTLSVQHLKELIIKKGDSSLWNVMTFLLNSLLIRLISNNKNKDALIDREKEIKNKLIVEKPLEELIKIWEKINSMVYDTNRINLDKTAVIISIFEEFNFSR